MQVRSTAGNNHNAVRLGARKSAHAKRMCAADRTWQQKLSHAAWLVRCSAEEVALKLRYSRQVTSPRASASRPGKVSQGSLRHLAINQ